MKLKRIFLILMLISSFNLHWAKESSSWADYSSPAPAISYVTLSHMIKLAPKSFLISQKTFSKVATQGCERLASCSMNPELMGVNKLPEISQFLADISNLIQE